MGTGTDAARAAGAGIHADVIDNMKDQLLLVLIERLGGDVTIPVAEIDGTGGKTLAMSLDTKSREFNFKLGHKH
jgi:hypothetical protein